MGQSPTPSFHRIRSGRVFEEVLEQIRSAIFSGEFGPGEKLPTERELVSSFGVSRASVREALRILELSGVVVVRHGSTGGFFVAHKPPEPLKFALEALMENQKFGVRELFDAKLFFEERVAEEAARFITEDELKKLRSNIEQCERQLVRGEDIKELNTEFHVILTHVLGNPVLDELVGGLVDLVDGLEQPPARSMDFAKTIVLEHRMILEALASRKPRKAGAAMVSHLRTVETLFLRDRPTTQRRFGRVGGTKAVGAPAARARRPGARPLEFLVGLSTANGLRRAVKR